MNTEKPQPKSDITKRLQMIQCKTTGHLYFTLAWMK